MKTLFSMVADYIRETDKIMLMLVTAASGYGCLAVFSATYPSGSPRQFLVQVISMLAGLVVAIIISNIDYNDIIKWWYFVVPIGLIPVILTFFFWYAPGNTDDKAWLLLPGGTSFQPSELLKICFIITFSAHLSAVKKNINKIKVLLPVVLHGIFPVALIYIQGDFGTAIVFAVIFVFMLFTAELKLRYIITAVVTALVASPFVYFFILNDAHRERISTMFNLEADLLGGGYQQWQGRIALANGGFFGQGYLKGELTQAETVPEGHNDFIFVSIGEELGLLGCLAVAILLVAICLRCIRVAKLCNTDSAKFIAIGVFGMILAQTVINLGMCLSVLPVIGVTLPFFSAGGTSLICLMLGIGLILSLYKHRNSGTIHIQL